LTKVTKSSKVGTVLRHSVVMHIYCNVLIKGFSKTSVSHGLILYGKTTSDNHKLSSQ